MYKQRELYASYQGPKHQVFEIIEHYSVAEDPWVRYRNTQTQQEYTCRQAAFLQRFSQLPN